MDIRILEEVVRKSIKQILKENSQFNEEYPSSFNMDEFLKISSFSKRIEYCEVRAARSVLFLLRILKIN